MNETPDGTEPLGENPEITTPQIRALRAAASTIVQATHVIDRNAAIIDELRGLHRQTGSECADCEECEVPWPCETMRIIDAVRL